MIELSTIDFLIRLKKNNNKPWFEQNRAKYISAKNNFEEFVKEVISLVSTFDDDMKLLEAKNCTFRINRDVRFSKDKTPYKSNMGAYFNKGGKKSIFGGYYFHLEPGDKSFVGGGVWMPAPQELQKIRQEIDYCFPEFKKIINGKVFTGQYTGLEMNKNDMLVNVPKGYDKNNPAAGFLKLKSFVVTKNIPDTHLNLPSLPKEISQAFKALMPLVRFMNSALE